MKPHIHTWVYASFKDIHTEIFIPNRLATKTHEWKQEYWFFKVLCNISCKEEEEEEQQQEQRIENFKQCTCMVKIKLSTSTIWYQEGINKYCFSFFAIDTKLYKKQNSP